MLKRGRQLMRAINDEYPGITILFLFGRSISKSPSYDLYGAFFDGMVAAADNRTRLIDGYEYSYSYKIPEQFAKGRTEILDTQRSLSRFPWDYGHHVRAGFGLWLDQASHQPGMWNPDNPEENYHPPWQWEQTLTAALEASDGYVWIYSQRFNWWTGAQLDPGYISAQQAALGAVTVNRE